MVTSFIIDPDDSFRKALNKSIKKVDDLTIPFGLMSKAWFKGNRSIFDEGRKSPGQYDDLSPKYKKRKTKILGSPYPILIGFNKRKQKSGKLAKSMLDARNKDSVNKVINKKTLILGTKVKTKKGSPYAIYLHHGTGKMPARPFVLLGGEQVATPEINKRREAWIEMLNDYVMQVSQGFGKKV